MIRAGARLCLLAVSSIAAIGCDAGTITPIHADDGDGEPGGDSGGGGGDLGVPTVTIDFDATDADLLNPERGFFRTIDLIAGGEARQVRRSGHTLAQAIVRLDDYRDRPLDQALLTALENGLAEVRAAGIK